jgi:hypothetical protein
MNLFRLFNQQKKDESYRARSRILSKLQGRDSFNEDEVNEIFAYKRIEYHSNPDTRKITGKIFSSQDLGEKFRLLRRLNGVGVILASTILMFQNPHKYAELDPKCWMILRRDFGFKGAEKDHRSDYGIPEYISYLEALKPLADEYGMNVSDVAYVMSLAE